MANKPEQYFNANYEQEYKYYSSKKKVLGKHLVIKLGKTKFFKSLNNISHLYYHFPQEMSSWNMKVYSKSPCSTYGRTKKTDNFSKNDKL